MTYRCGDGNLDPGEDCDDGNLRNDDGCDSRCLTECEDDRFTGPFCRLCSDPRFKGDRCDECVDERFIGANCDECANPLKTGEMCDECLDPRFTGENCDACAPFFEGEDCAAAPCMEGDNCPDLDFVTIEGGLFRMGSNQSRDEQPLIDVTVPQVQLTRTEITVGQYRACVDAGACDPPQCSDEDRSNGVVTCNWTEVRENHPVNFVTWHNAYQFAAWVGARLPSEAEWEFVARGGGQAQKYPWGIRSPPATEPAMWPVLAKELSPSAPCQAVCHGRGFATWLAISVSGLQTIMSIPIAVRPPMVDHDVLRTIAFRMACSESSVAVLGTIWRAACAPRTATPLAGGRSAPASASDWPAKRRNHSRKIGRRHASPRKVA